MRQRLLIFRTMYGSVWGHLVHRYMIRSHVGEFMGVFGGFMGVFGIYLIDPGDRSFISLFIPSPNMSTETKSLEKAQSALYAMFAAMETRKRIAQDKRMVLVMQYADECLQALAAFISANASHLATLDGNKIQVYKHAELVTCVARIQDACCALESPDLAWQRVIQHCRENLPGVEDLRLAQHSERGHFLEITLREFKTGPAM